MIVVLIYIDFFGEIPKAIYCDNCSHKHARWCRFGVVGM